MNGITREHLSELLAAALAGLKLPISLVTKLVDETFEQLSENGDAISVEAFKRLCEQQPRVLSFMHLPQLSDLTASHPRYDVPSGSRMS